MRSAFSKAIVAAAQADQKILLLTGDHGYALFDEFRSLLPAQFVNAGIAEQNMVGVAAGLAKVGYKPIVYGLSAFVPVRVIEQIKMDVCYEKLPIIFIGDGAGVVYSSLGSSHQSTEDIAMLRPLPNLEILSPCDSLEMDYAMSYGLQFQSPVYIRMGKSDVGVVHKTAITAKLGDLLPVRSGKNSKIAFLATGSMVSVANRIANELLDCSVWSVPSLKPINEEQVLKIADLADDIVVLEEHSTAGGLGSIIAEIVSSVASARVTRFGVQDRFSEKCGSYQYLMKEHGLDFDTLKERLSDI
ncbi:transketolase family protein [Janthinobacterium sp. DSP2-3-3]|uniref:transketolase family protein n=1 Tax=Janthinobacterium sp. DSP2-3-3 TaxID=2804596 RepID=UPI003CEB2F43